MKLPDNVKYIIEAINKNGYRADVVGGPVRDFLLGKEPHDYDITTDATPDEVKRIFADRRTVDTGLKHGTVTLVLDGENYEITTYRIDGEYTDSRHPDSVSFTVKIEEDLARRDFTVNAIAYNPRDGITDPYGGREDIEHRLIRAVGDPVLRFSEDALRILRGIRFSATLGFSIDPPTVSAMRECSHLLPRVSAERVYTELSKLISGDFAYDVLTEFSDLVAIFLPELREMKLPGRSLFEKADYMSRLTSLFYLNLPSGAPEAFESAMKRLKTDSRTSKGGRAMLAAVGKFDTATDRGLTYLLSELGEELARAELRLEILLGKRGEEALCRIEKLLDSGIAYRISDLEVGGSDLLALGYSGKALGNILARLLTLVMDGEIANDREALLLTARKMQ